ncbi:MAG: hypothetical protein P9L96_01100 [Candidatus Gygaella obscura]|nr:hypothetical protein [Candidatus Gygaella obscura]
MPYDANLDEKIFVKSIDTDLGRIDISVYSYNKGDKKLQITRENRTAEGEFRFTKLGRLNKKEIESALPVIKEALEKMS